MGPHSSRVQPSSVAMVAVSLTRAFAKAFEGTRGQEAILETLYGSSIDYLVRFLTRLYSPGPALWIVRCTEGGSDVYQT